MVYPLKTQMEKNQRFKELKEVRKLPEILTNKFEAISNLILEMTDYNPEKRPCAYYIYHRVINELSYLENCINASFSNKRSTINEAISKSEAFKIEIKREDCMDWLESYVKIINGKLLILPNVNSSKANYAYDLKECEINKNGNIVEIDHPFLNKILIRTYTTDIIKRMENEMDILI